jgi:hypothetical protein
MTASIYNWCRGNQFLVSGSASRSAAVMRNVGGMEWSFVRQ